MVRIGKIGFSFFDFSESGRVTFVRMYSKRFEVWSCPEVIFAKPIKGFYSRAAASLRLLFVVVLVGKTIF